VPEAKHLGRICVTLQRLDVDIGTRMRRPGAGARIDGISSRRSPGSARRSTKRSGCFLGRPIEDPYLWLDTTLHKVHEGGRVVSVATVVAIG
jgi:hypothetical protein